MTKPHCRFLGREQRVTPGLFWREHSKHSGSVNIKCLSDQHLSGRQAVSNFDKEILHSVFSSHKDNIIQLLKGPKQNKTKHKCLSPTEYGILSMLDEVLPANPGVGAILFSRSESLSTERLCNLPKVR